MTRDAVTPAEVHAARQRFEAAFVGAPIGMAIVALDGTWLEVNPALCRITGYPAQVLLTKTFQDITHPDDLDLDLAHAARLASGEIGSYRIDKRYVRADGSHVWVELTGGLLRDPAGEPEAFIAQVRDIHEERMAREALAASERRLQSILSTMSEGVAVHGADGAITAVNAAAAEILRISEEELRAATNERWAPRCVHEDGSPYAADEHPSVVALRTGEPVRQAIMGVRAGDAELRWLSINAQPMREHDGGPGGVVTTFSDVTALREAVTALERSNDALREFTYGASHDLRGPLRTILGFTELVRQRLARREDAADERLDEWLALIGQSAERMRELLETLLAYATITAKEPERAPVDLGEVVEAVRADLAADIRRREVRVLVEGPLPRVHGDRARLHQLFQNLLGNALKFGPDGGTVRVRGSAHDGAWHVAVSDEGPGIAAESHARVFEPFTRLHDGDVPGAGLGLTLCRRIAEQHAGAIRVSSREGEGATFTVVLPCA